MNTGVQSDISLLLASGQFDSDWYARRYPDVMQAGMSPAEHYLWLGKRLGRRAKPGKSEDELIDLQAFVSRTPKVQPSIPDAGPSRAEMVDKLAKWPGLDKAYICYQLKIDIQHDNNRVAELYYEELRNRNVLPNAIFDPEYYRFINNLRFREDSVYHYLTQGAINHLDTHYLFDHDWYFKHYPSSQKSTDLVVDYWLHGYKDGVLPIDPDKIEILEQIKKVFFSDVFDKNAPDFDAVAYRMLNPDLAGLSDEDLAIHFNKNGRHEGRLASLSTVLRNAGLPGHCLPIDFDPEQYVSLHVDLEKDFTDSPWRSLVHYASGGLLEGRIYTFNQVSHVRPLSYVLDEENVTAVGQKTTLCVLVHLYYPDMWDELKPYIANIDVDFDLYVNFVESTWLSSIVSQVREDFPHAKIKISPNEGRDIGGFFSLLREVDFSKYLAFTLLHSKKSPHVTRDYAALWKKNLLGAILGSKHMVRENVAAFLADDEIGIIGSIRTRHVGLESNKDGMRRLFHLYGITPENEECEYVSGTMMMVRSEVIQAVYAPLADHLFVNGDNKGIDHHIDGQVEHSVERIFGNVMRQLGYRFLWR